MAIRTFDSAAHAPGRSGSGMRMLRVVLLSLALPALIAGCGLPRGAALQSEVLRGTDSDDSSIQVVAITRETLPDIQQWPVAHPELRHNWATTGASQTARIIRAGDQINLAIWDSQADSLLTSGLQRNVNMQNIPVSATGRVFIPYIGEVRVSGMTAEQARRTIQNLLGSIVADGQVQMNVIPGTRNTIDVVTGVLRPGRVQLDEVSPTILSVLAASGGIAANVRNPLVRLNRAGESYAIPSAELFSNPANDIPLRGGDRVFVEEDGRNYIALGAAGREQVVYFEREEISTLDALSTIGGLADNRANLRGLMVMREYPGSMIRDEGNAPRKPQVIFTFDLTSADGLFAAQRFLIQPGDVVLATESVAPLFGTVVGLFRAARNVAN